MPQPLCQPRCCPRGDFGKEPPIFTSTETYPDHVFDYPPGDNRVLLDQLCQVVQPCSCGRNTWLSPTDRERLGQTPVSSAVGVHAHTVWDRPKDGVHPSKSLWHPGDLGGTQGTPRLRGFHRTSGALGRLVSTHGTSPFTPTPVSGSSTRPAGHSEASRASLEHPRGLGTPGPSPGTREVPDRRPRSQQEPRLLRSQS